MFNFQLSDWYWVVSGKSGVYSSKAADYVPVNDADYGAWKGAGNTATKIDSEASLWATLNQPIFDQLADLDARSMRALRNVAGGKGNESYSPSVGVQTTPVQFLQSLETQADALRAQLKK